MFLGIFYHLQFMDSGGFGMMGFGATSNPKGSVDAWLHSFRMPLFFLISGFFANMVLVKYGFWKYMARRWWRIGAPLFAAFVIFGVLRTYFPAVTSAAFNFKAPAASTATAGAFGQMGGGMMPGFGGMSFGAAPGGANPFAGAGFGAAPGTTNANSFGANPFGWPQQPGQTNLSAAGAQAAFQMPAFTMPNQPTNHMAEAICAGLNRAQDWVFDKMPWMSKCLTAVGGETNHLSTDNFHFEHLWFLWYLLVFVTLAPGITIP